MLASRADLPAGKSPKSADKSAGPSRLVMIAGAPVAGRDGKILGALYGGILLNQNFNIVDRIWEVVFQGDRLDDRDIGVVTIFQNDMRVSTTLKTAGGVRWVGTGPRRQRSAKAFSGRGALSWADVGGGGLVRQPDIPPARLRGTNHRDARRGAAGKGIHIRTQRGYPIVFRHCHNWLHLRNRNHLSRDRQHYASRG